MSSEKVESGSPFLSRARSLLDYTLIARSNGSQMAAGGRLEARLLDSVALCAAYARSSDVIPGVPDAFARVLALWRCFEGLVHGNNS